MIGLENLHVPIDQSDQSYVKPRLVAFLTPTLIGALRSFVDSSSEYPLLAPCHISVAVMILVLDLRLSFAKRPNDQSNL